MPDRVHPLLQEEPPTAIAHNIDPGVCSALLRSITDQLLAEVTKPAPDATLPEIISEVRATGERAPHPMRSALFAHHPGVDWAKGESFSARFS